MPSSSASSSRPINEGSANHNNHNNNNRGVYTTTGTTSSNTATATAAAAASVVPMAHYPPMEHRFPSSLASNSSATAAAAAIAGGRSTSDTATATVAGGGSSGAPPLMPRPRSNPSLIGNIMSATDATATPTNYKNTAAVANIPNAAASSSLQLQQQQQQQQQQAQAQQQQQAVAAEQYKPPRVTGSCRIRFCNSPFVATINNAPIIISSKNSSFYSAAAAAAAVQGGGRGRGQQQQQYYSSSFGAASRQLFNHQVRSSSSSSATDGHILSNTATSVAGPYTIGTSMTAAASSSSTTRLRKKMRGPVLLELQRLEIDETRIISTITSAPYYNNSNHHNNNNSGELFRLRTVARSRGNPSLGTSISSTCLDVMTVPSSATAAAAAAANQNLLPLPCATGLTTGALCIHTFGLNSNGSRGGGGSMNSNDIAMVGTNNDNDNPEDATSSSSFEYSCNIDYFHIPRHHRPATAVAWQPHKFSVAIAWASRTGDASAATVATMNAATSGGGGLGSGSSNSGGIAGAPANSSSSFKNLPRGVGGASGVVGAASMVNSKTAAGMGRVGATSVGGQTSDRDYGCFVWDVSQSVTATTSGSSVPLGHKRTSSSTSEAAPIAKLAHQSGVASLAWVLDSPTLAVGGQLRNVQIYDLRVSGQTAPPITFYAHNFGVHGIQTDPHRSHLFATFCSVHKEPVKIWDARRLDSDVCEIKVGSAYSTSTMDDAAAGYTTPTGVSAIQWSTVQPGNISIAVGDTIYDYDTSSSSRPIHKETVYARAPISDFCLYRQQQQPTTTDYKNDDDLLSVLYPRRALVVHSDRSIHDMAMHRLAPLDVSRRDGRLVHGLGRILWVGPTNQGPAAMESSNISPNEDISATMMRRARCLRDAKYSMDTKSNIKILAEDGIVTDGSALLRLWSWVERVESLCAESWQDETSWDGWNWPAKGLADAGAIELLRMDTDGAGADGSRSTGAVDKEEFCEALSCITYHSPGRRAAMTSCGWAGKFDLTNVLGECEGLEEYERSAALAVWHADIGAAVEALQRGAAAIRAKKAENLQYAETLELVSLCIAGYRGGDINTSSSSIWRRACANLMQRSDLSVKNQSRVAYMTGLLKFLMSLGSDNGYQEVLFDQSLSLCDRAAFACRFLEREKLQQFLGKCISDCQTSGNIEGVTITGIEKEGMKILQSYVDRFADVQTAALITSRVILPQTWIDERRTSAEWLGAYRGLLNTWQMWQSRAMFDVDRAELLRQVKSRQVAAENMGGPSLGGRTGSFPGRRAYAPPPGRKLSRQQPFDPDVQAAVPAQIDARCNYCNAPLGLRQRDTTEASQWLSKMKPVLSCCPQCRKPLPRCSICMLSLGTLNPYMELTKERSRQARSSSGRQSPDDYLSTMTNLPFAEWPSWCLKCRHVGHTHHLVGWFSKHDVCPVSGCNCRCQFDGILKLNRPALSRKYECKKAETIMVQEPTS